jgi:hypothetical protein
VAEFIFCTHILDEANENNPKETCIVCSFESFMSKIATHISIRFGFGSLDEKLWGKFDRSNIMPFCMKLRSNCIRYLRNNSQLKKKTDR